MVSKNSAGRDGISVETITGVATDWQGATEDNCPPTADWVGPEIRADPESLYQGVVG
jgi:hypothetical protein